jgi:two-component system phosphate regulon sensor histidine kinase PhoR
MNRPWKNRVVVRLFLSYLAVVLLLFVLFYLYATATVKDFHISSLSAKMRDEAKIVMRLLPVGLEGAALDRICRDLGRDLGVRITVIALDGKVLGDSDESSAAMENHGARPEVVEALAGGAGQSTRYSTTVHHEMLYQAVLSSEGNRRWMVRLSLPLDSIEVAENSIRRAMLSGLLVFSSLGLLAVFIFSRRLDQRIKRILDFSDNVAKGVFSQQPMLLNRADELSILEANLNRLSRSIQEKIASITAEKEKVDSILRCMTEGVLVVDTQGRLILLNQNAQKMFGLQPAQNLQGASLMEISRHPEMRTLSQEVLSCDCSTECFTREICLDEGKWFQVNAVSLRGADDKPLGYILVFHDVTVLKRLETVRSDFVANVSHELRTPLTAIRGYAETLLRSPPADPKQAEHFLGIIHRHSERLGRLIDDLLTLSDLESGKIQITREKLQAAELIGKVLEIFQDQAQRKNIALVRQIEPGLSAILGDPDRLQQLLINLIDNALKYTDKGSITVAAGLAGIRDRELGIGAAPESPTPNSQSPTPNSRRWVELSVSDTGCGIPEKELPRLTERFYRVDKARSRELGGTGLGLAIVKHIVHAHGGSLAIESRLQKGTTVRILLPAGNEATAKQILFLCTANSCRSQMAEGFARKLAPGDVTVYSAGSEPTTVHPLAIRVMKEAGIDISAQRSKSLGEVPVENIDLVVTLCGEAAESCPTFPAKTERRHWPLSDPALAEGDEEGVLKTFREVRDEIRARVKSIFSA